MIPGASPQLLSVLSSMAKKITALEQKNTELEQRFGEIVQRLVAMENFLVEVTQHEEEDDEHG